MNSLIAFEQALPVLVMIFVAVFLLIFLARIILFFVINQAYKHYKKLADTTKKILPQSKKKFDKFDDELRRKREIPRAHSAVKADLMAQGEARSGGSYELIPSQENQLDKEEMNKVEIVDIVKPIGFWTSMILGQKLTYLIQSAQTINKRGNKGFWVSMVEAKDRAAGRQHARGR